MTLKISTGYLVALVMARWYSGEESINFEVTT